jgi:nitrous oxidase accessory protein
MDSGVFVEQSATAAVVEDNKIEDNLFGIYPHGAPNAIARNTVIGGLQPAERGLRRQSRRAAS